MAKKKPKAAKAAAAAKQSHKHDDVSVEASPAADGSTRSKQPTSVSVTVIVALVLAILSAFLFHHDTNTTNVQHHDSITDSNATLPRSKDQTKEAFLNWFIERGGTFHPINVINGHHPSNDSLSVNVTLEEFPSFGGWGLALSIPKSILPWSINDDDGITDDVCKSASQQEDQCTSAQDEHPQSLPQQQQQQQPIIKHLDPLFAIPHSIILSVQSILDTYATPTHPLYVPHFQPRLDGILKRALPHGAGLTSNKDMGLMEQDVVMALFLMVEDCQHRIYTSSGAIAMIGDGGVDSEWGPYLDVLPDYLIPRLDTFGDEEYAVLNDAVLEGMGRESKRLLLQMYLNGRGESDGDDTITNFATGSFKSILYDMIGVKMGSLPSSSSSPLPTIPPSCTSFETFHRFVAIASSRAMVLKGRKYLTPLAEMINYAPVTMKQTQQHHQGEHQGGSLDWIRPPFDLYHTFSADDGIAVRSDRDVLLSKDTIDYIHQNTEEAVIQLFEDYGPVDSSLFLEAHGFVPCENPHHCAVISGALLMTNVGGTTSGVAKDDIDLLTRALKALHLIDPRSAGFETLGDVCVRADLSIVEDGSTIGQKPASDSIAMTSLLFGKHTEAIAMKELCVKAIESSDVDRIEVRCARYPESRKVVRNVLRAAASSLIWKYDRSSDEEIALESLISQLQVAEAEGRGGLAVALRFRIEERKLLARIANCVDEVIDSQQLTDSVTMDSLDNIDNKLKDFNTFIQTLALPVNKIEPQLVGNGMRIGVFATHDLNVGDVYVSLPPNAIIDTNTALIDANPSLEQLLRRYSSQRDDGFNAMLIYLIHERFVLGEQSRWWPYLNLLPSIEELRTFHPLYYDEDEVNKHLAGSDVRRYIFRYQRLSSERHASFSSDLEANLVLGSDTLLDKSKFLWASAILDARSIWWNGQRHLVPLLDLVNSDTKGDSHQTRLEGSEEDQGMAVTRVSRQVKKGQQLMENYAQPNYVLFTHHGFVLNDNPNDCALMEGLVLRKDDPGAKLAHLLQSTAPSFCIKDLASVHQLAHFLRVKHGLQLNSEIDDVVRPYLVQVLEERIARLREALNWSIVLEEASARVRFMQQIVKFDLMHFQHALNVHVLSRVEAGV